MSSKTIIIGAGITGLSLAYHLKKPYLVLEKENKPGGLCRSERVKGCTFDYSGHFIHFHRGETLKFVKNILGGNHLAKISRNAGIYTHKVTVPYPFQANLYALPEKIRKECLDGFINKPSASHFPLPTSNFFNWSMSTFGNGITKYFMKPYNEKLWAVSSKKLTTEWVAPFVPQPTLKEIRSGASQKQEKRFGYNTCFSYPKEGGIQSLINGISAKTKNIKLNTEAKKIDIKERYVETANGQRHYFNRLISTQPLPALLDQIVGLPVEVRQARKKLLWNSVCCLNAAFKSSKMGNMVTGTKVHWLYFPEKKYSFYRVGVYSNILNGMAPKGLSSLYIEISRQAGKTKFNRKNILAGVIQGLEASGIINKGAKPEIVSWMDMPCAYVIYDKNYTASLKTIMNFLKKNHIQSTGRYGGWKYSFMEESIWESMQLAKEINEN